MLFYGFVKFKLYIGLIFYRYCLYIMIYIIGIIFMYVYILMYGFIKNIINLVMRYMRIVLLKISRIIIRDVL